VGRRRKCGQSQTLETLLWMVKQEPGSGLDPYTFSGSEQIQETHSSIITRDQNMLTVVHGFAGTGIHERVRPTTRKGFLFIHRNGDTSPGKDDAGREST